MTLSILVVVIDAIFPIGSYSTVWEMKTWPQSPGPEGMTFGLPPTPAGNLERTIGLKDILGFLAVFLFTRRVSSNFRA